MVLMLRKCCCGCTLKTGTIILGVLNVLGGLSDLIRGTAAVLSANKELNEENKKALIGENAVVAVLGALMLLVAICLIIGAVKGIPVLLVPWLVYTIVYMIVTSIILFIIAYYFFSTEEIGMGVGSLVGAAICIVLETYFLLVVYSLYRELKGTAPPNCA